MTGMILVSGATGNAGGATVDALAATGEEVRAASRSERESSSAVPGDDLDNAVARYHILAERTVRESGLAWTMLQPNSFMTNTLQWVPQLRAGDLVRAPFAGVAVATIDPADVGAVAALALAGPGHEGRTYRLSGPESLRPADRVRILGEVLGRDLRFEGQPDAEARTEMSGAMPAEYVDAFFSFFADGKLDESEVLPTVSELLRREPGTFREWAAANAESLTMHLRARETGERRRSPGSG